MGLIPVGSRLDYICTKTIEWSLIFIIAVVPLIINPAAFDVWYRPKIEAVYALVIINGIAWGLKTILIDGRFSREFNPVAIPLLCYLAVAAVSTAVSVNVRLSLFGDPLRVEGLFSVMTYGALVLLFVHLITTRALLNTVSTGLIAVATLVSLFALVQYFGYDPTEHFFYKYWRRGPGVGSTIGNQNFLGKYLVLIIPVVFSMCLNAVNQKRRTVAVMSLVCCCAALTVTFTRASWLSIVVGLSIYLCLAFRNALLAHRTRVLAVCLSMILVTVVVLNLYVPQTAAGKSASFKKSEPGAVVKRTVSAVQFREGRGVATRFYVWKKALHMIMERPWFGYGLETFQLAFQPYNREYTERFNDYTTVDRIHNNYLDTAFTLGMAGLACYLAVIVTFMCFLRGLIRRGHNTSRRLWYVGIFSGFCGYLLNDLFIFSVVSVSPTFWSLMGLTIAAGNLDRAEEIC